VHNWEKILMYTRALFGFVAPATPNFAISSTGLGKEFTDLLAVMPNYNDAVTAFIKAHGTAATPYTVFASTTGGVGQSGAYIPATQNALDFIAANRPFFDKYAQAAPWLFPLSSTRGPFADQAYQNELQMGLRSRRAFGPQQGTIGHDWLDEVIYAMNANVYFPYEASIKAAQKANPAQKQVLQAEWDQWSAAFKNAHPMFADLVGNPDARDRRLAVISQMLTALHDPLAPQTKETDHLRVLMDAYQQVVDNYNATRAYSADASTRKAWKEYFLGWGAQYAAAFPDVAPFWSGVLSLSVPG
jgi:hypothetical protein